MRILMLGSAAILLSGCSFLGIGGQKNDYTNYNPQAGYYGQQQSVATAPKSQCHSGNCLARWNLEGGIGAVFPAGKTSSRQAGRIMLPELILIQSPSAMLMREAFALNSADPMR